MNRYFTLYCESKESRAHGRTFAFFSEISYTVPDKSGFRGKEKNGLLRCPKKYRRETKTLMVVTALVILAVICRLISIYDIADDGLNYFFSLMRTVIYIGIIITWGVSVRNRVINRSIRRYMQTVAALLLFWFVIRSCKFFFMDGIISLQYYCWYSYYIPMILIPMIGIYIAFCLGKTENYTLPLYMKALIIPAAVAIVLIFTNNFHQLVFGFPFGRAEADPVYIYRPLYFVCLGLIIAETLLFLILLLMRSQVPYKRKRIWGPVLPAAAGILYAIGYIAGFPAVFIAAGDMTAVLTLIMLSVCELCIQNGLIPSNTRYSELLKASTIGAQITDADFNRCIVSDNAKEFSKELMRRAVKEPVEIGNERLSGAPVTGGYVLWVEDISMVKDVMKKLEKISSRLSANNNLLKAEVELKEKQSRADEQRRIYDRITEEVEPQLKRLELLLEPSSDPVKTRENLGYACVMSAYIKRLGNLILLGEEATFLMSRELEYSFRESMENLRLCGVATSLSCICEGIISKDSAVAAYEFFEMVLEAALPTMKAILVNLTVEDRSVKIIFALSCPNSSVAADREFLKRHNAYAEVSEDGDDVRITFLMPKGGDTK